MPNLFRVGLVGGVKTAFTIDTTDSGALIFVPLSGEYELLADITVSSATSAIDITGLGIISDDEILLVSNIVNNVTAATHYIYVNENYTNSSYCSQVLRANSSSISADRYNIPIIDYNVSGHKLISHNNIQLTGNGVFTCQNSANMGHNTSGMYLHEFYCTSTFSMASIYQIRIASSVANAIGNGSRFQLYRKGTS